eukprot:CAMPEP_0170611290 /NCGR_PEP_ID=MMETSP0224-20130122/23111_1 /TAXON_ID=285029 /ORGANISM="Togula jolla, Strain CCCM 725" /LENGTH=109 /DNA_ID=CAMNT_0010936717 /DNA_START=440 /DNA_END=769 /DNA_ORIENTATION=-
MNNQLVSVWIPSPTRPLSSGSTHGRGWVLDSTVRSPSTPSSEASGAASGSGVGEPRVLSPPGAFRTIFSNALQYLWVSPSTASKSSPEKKCPLFSSKDASRETLVISDI